MISFLAPFARGQDFSSRLDQLAKSEKWLRLGHYEKGWFGPTSPFRGMFFIHPDGHKNPRAEIAATVEAFLHPTPQQLKLYKMSPQCFFMARFRWLNQELKFDPSMIDPCTSQREWKKKLNATAVSLIFASADMNSAPSTFGHTFLKLINPENKKSKELIDYGINYAADSNPHEGVLYGLKGLFGFYKGFFTMMPYHQKIHEYTNMEGRDLWEYRLNLTPAEVDELIEHFLEMENSRAPYYFLSDNCSYQLTKALEVARADMKVTEELPVYAIPLDIVKYMARTPGLTQPPVYQKSLKADYLFGYNHLNRDQRRALTEVLTSLTISNDQFSAKQQAEVYETAMKFFALKAYETQSNQDETKHKLAVKRAKLGMVTGIPNLPIPERPENSHDSAALYFSAGESEMQGGFYGFKLRPAFHDLEQVDSGMVPFSHIEILTSEFRYYPEQERLSIHRLTLANLLNSTPLTKLDRHMSWRTQIELLDQWAPHIMGGGGTTLDFGRHLQLVQLITVKYLDGFLGAGPNMILAAHFGRLGLSLDGGYYFGTNGRKLWDLTSRADLQLARSWDLQFSHLNQREWETKLLYNFLF